MRLDIGRTQSGLRVLQEAIYSCAVKYGLVQKNISYKWFSPTENPDYDSPLLRLVAGPDTVSLLAPTLGSMQST